MNLHGQPLDVVFAGTPGFAVPSLNALLDSRHHVVGVYSQPDRAAGRGRSLRPSAVKQRAAQAGLPIHQPSTLRDESARQLLARLRPDVLVVVAYGLILPAGILEVPRLGCINVHASLLPRWRGAAPVQRAILAGDQETGISIMQMDTGLDTGPVFARARLQIPPGATAGELAEQLAETGGRCLLEVLDALSDGRATATAQDSDGTCYAAKLTRAQARLDWSLDAELLARQVRAFNPGPVAYTLLEDVPLKVWQASPLAEQALQVAGTVVAEDSQGVRVACGRGQLLLTELQLPGKRRMQVRDFLNGHTLAGARLR